MSKEKGSVIYKGQNKMEQLSVKFNEGQFEHLGKKAQEQGISRGAIIRQLVQRDMEN